jgi:hypothetical protein
VLLSVTSSAGATWWSHATIGALGAVALQAAQLTLYVQRTGHTPWRSRRRRAKFDRYGQPLPDAPIFALAITCKALTGLVLVGALSAGGQVQTPLTALLLGAAATDLLQRAAAQVSLPDGSVAGGSVGGGTAQPQLVDLAETRITDLRLEPGSTPTARRHRSERTVRRRGTP